MYTVKYQLKTKKIPETESSETYLKAKFRFRNEVAPKDEAEVRSVIHLISKGKYPEYFPKTNFLEEIYNKGFTNRYFRISGTTKIIGISEHIFSLGFSIKVTAKGKVPLEEMVDLDALNSFVLNKKKK